MALPLAGLEPRRARSGGLSTIADRCDHACERYPSFHAEAEHGRDRVGLEDEEADLVPGREDRIDEANRLRVGRRLGCRAARAVDRAFERLGRGRQVELGEEEVATHSALGPSTLGAFDRGRYCGDPESLRLQNDAYRAASSVRERIPSLA